MRTTLLFLLGFFIAGTSKADSFAQADLNPYVRVHASRSYTDLLGVARFDDQDYMITRGGGVLAAEASWSTGREFSNLLIRGTGEAGQLNSLKRTLTTNKIGAQTDCRDPLGLDGSYEITWYGKSGRRNSFTAYLGTFGPTDLPSCPSGVAEMIRAINDYVNHVANRRGTEVLRSK